MGKTTAIICSQARRTNALKSTHSTIPDIASSSSKLISHGSYPPDHDLRLAVVITIIIIIFSQIVLKNKKITAVKVESFAIAVKYKDTWVLLYLNSLPWCMWVEIYKCHGRLARPSIAK